MALKKTEGIVSWRSPSNIALIKYWGKTGFQVPANPSLSMTLRESYTETSVRFTVSTTPGVISFEFFFEDKENPVFKEKIFRYLQHLIPEMPFLLDFHLEIRSRNTFPHSAGIASSASAMSALALCLCSLEQEINSSLSSSNVFFQRASHIARIGSGSAGRSLYGGYSIWGKTWGVPGSSDLFAVPLATYIHPVFESYCDTIVIVSKGEKKVSSRTGHDLMKGHHYAEARYQQASSNLQALMKALSSGDTDTFVRITENEALSLHAMMMASEPGFFLVHANTLMIIERIREYREQTSLPVCFTLDAGPNVHILYPAAEEKKIGEWIRKNLTAFAENEMIITDRTGKGPVKLV